MSDLNDKKIEILQVSEKLFAEHGFAGTSVRDIATAANINVAMISYYFGSKEKLLEAMVLYRIESLTLQLENLYQEDISPMEKMDKLIALYIKRIYSNQAIYMILHLELATKKRECNLEVFSKVKKHNLKLLQNIIFEGQEQGLFQPNIDVEMIQPTIIGTLNHILVSKAYHQEILGLEDDAQFENYIFTTFTSYIQKIIKSFLTYEN